MNMKELAALLNGRKYGNEITRDEERMARAAGLVVLFGYSDDNAEFRGAINDEAGCYGGGTIYLDADGLVSLENCDNEDCKLRKQYLARCKAVEAVWSEGGYAWTYKTNIPHETFEIFEDGEKYCRGIVFELSALN